MSRRWLVLNLVLAVATLTRSVLTDDVLAAVGYVVAGGLAALVAGAIIGGRGRG